MTRLMDSCLNVIAFAIDFAPRCIICNVARAIICVRQAPELLVNLILGNLIQTELKVIYGFQEELTFEQSNTIVVL